MKIQSIRCDDRLLHGQVIFKWIQKLHLNQIVIVDDLIVNDFMQKKLLKLSAPNSIPLEIMTCEQFAGQDDNRDRFILVQNLKTLEKLISLGCEVLEVNIGRIPAGRGKTKIRSGLYLDSQECIFLNDLMKKGTHVFVQQVPDDLPLEIEKEVKERCGMK